MEDSLLNYSESHLRTVFGRNWTSRPQDKGDVPPPDVDPLYPSLDIELPVIHRRERELYRPAWDPRERWRQLKPTQPLHAPPESDLPAQFRYEDLSALEKSETMDIHQDRLLRWLVERFERSLEYKPSGDPLPSELTADEAIKHQEFTQLQILDEQLQNLGLSGSDQTLYEKRQQLLLEAAAARNIETGTPSAQPISTTAAPLSSSGTWEQEGESEEEFTPLLSPKKQVVVTVHETEPKPQRRRALLECGDVPSEDAIECHVTIKQPLLPHRSSKVAQFGDCPSSSSDANLEAGKKFSRKIRMAEDAV